MAKLSDTKIRAAKAKGKPYKLFDQDGLFLIVHPSGGRWWRQRYRWAGKEQLLSLGTYPEVTLAQARDKGAAVRAQVANGIDPSAERQQRKASQLEGAGRTYKVVALGWLERTSKGREWTVDHTQRVRRRLEINFFPYVGRKPIADVTDDDILVS